ncbi:MAG: hypothetical protein U0133_17315 [Gemmatimonadales bacterium]
MPRLTWPALAGLILGACSLGSSNTYPASAPVRPLTGLPATFAPVDSVTSGPATCRGRLSDPHDGALLILRSSQGGQVGDYQAPEGRYGLRAAEYVRVDCATLRPLGGVPRSR